MSGGFQENSIPPVPFRSPVRYVTLRYVTYVRTYSSQTRSFPEFVAAAVPHVLDDLNNRSRLIFTGEHIKVLIKSDILMEFGVNVVFDTYFFFSFLIFDIDCLETTLKFGGAGHILLDISGIIEFIQFLCKLVKLVFFDDESNDVHFAK